MYESTRRERSDDEGIVLLVLLLAMLPLAVVFAGFAGSMRARDSRLTEELARERCFWAAEAGIDDALGRAGAGLLVSGEGFRVELGSDLWADVTTTNLGSDGADNDGDTQVDEPDEDVVEVHSSGRHARYAREIVVWLGRTSFLPPFDAAATVSSPTTDVQLNGTPRLDGRNYRLDGTLADASSFRDGLAIMQPATIADLQSHLGGSEGDKVLGKSGPPSLGSTTTFDVPALVATLRNQANLVLTNDHYASYRFGETTAGSGVVAYRDGDLRVSGNCRGAGVLVVTGDLVVTGNFRFDGVVVVLGSLEAGAGTVDVYGAMVLGPDADRLRATGTFRMRYSEEAILVANQAAGRYVTFNGWQELAR